MTADGDLCDRCDEVVHRDGRAWLSVIRRDGLPRATASLGFVAAALVFLADQLSKWAVTAPAAAAASAA